jgi:hypothetical protein
MLDRNILKESIERSKREMIYLYYANREDEKIYSYTSPQSIYREVN